MTRTFFVWAILAPLASAVSFSVNSEEAGQKRLEQEFLGQTLSQSANTYIALKNVNVRKAPRTKSTRVGRFRKGVRITAVGRAKGTKWVAVRKDGKNMGFIYGGALAAVPDGTLNSVITGKLKTFDQPACDYAIKFEGKNKISGELQITSDYEVSLVCKNKNKNIKFLATMFITELPYKDYKTQVYQVNVDLPGVLSEEADVMSVTSLYHLNKSHLVFEAVTNPSMARKMNNLTKTVKSIPEVLEAAVQFSHQIWGPAVWRSVAGGN